MLPKTAEILFNGFQSSRDVPEQKENREDHAN